MTEDTNIFDFDAEDDTDYGREVEDFISSEDTDLWAVDDTDDGSFDTEQEAFDLDDLTQDDDAIDGASFMNEEFIDLDEDGVIDSIVHEFDLNDDGVSDIAVFSTDIDGDGTVDMVSYAEDIDFDGNADITMTYADTNADGEADYTEARYIETAEDGSRSEYFVRATDLDFDGEADNIEYGVDEFSANNDAIEDFDLFDDSEDPFDSPEAEETEDAFEETEDESEDIFEETEEESEDIFLDTEDESEDIPEEEYEETYDETEDEEYEDFFGEDDASDEDALVLPTVNYDTNSDNGTLYTDLDNFDASDADSDGVIGDPEDALDLWEFQGDTNRCAIFAQKFVIEEYTGEDLDIEELADLAEANGWFTEEGGTPIVYMDKILDHYNVPNEVSEGNSIDDIVESLNEGNRVIVAVDSDEYWYGENDSAYSPGDGVNHAVEVIGIDNSDPDNPVVILNDSGMPNGGGVELPLDTFMDAWEDGNNYMIECY